MFRKRAKEKLIPRSPGQRPPLNPVSRKDGFYDEDYKIDRVFSDPDPHRSILCQTCQDFINALHSHPWPDIARVHRDIGSSDYSHSSIGSYWRTIDLLSGSQGRCELCSMVGEILIANRDNWQIVNHASEQLKWHYQLKPTKFGHMLDLDPRRGFGQVKQVVKTIHDRWSLGIEVRDSSTKSQSRLLPCAIHCAPRPVPKFLSDHPSESAVPYEHRAILHGRSRSLACDMGLIRSWPDKCQRYHGRECGRVTSNTAKTKIRFIDTKDNCIVLMKLSSGKTIDYVALSYVWGDREQNYAASAEEYDALHNKGALVNLYLSRTVADAVSLVQKLGLRYLWVDALCIQQTSALDKHDQIAQMGFVYQNAIFTIVAAAGVNCDAGLRGFREGSRYTEQRVVQAGDYSLMRALQFPGDKILTAQTSKWTVRGWTFQEDLLSARQLIFTEEQIWWRCPCATWCEDTALETDDKVGFLLQDQSVKSRLEDRFSDLQPKQYFELVADYAQRYLSFPTDALNAFSGILTVLTQYSGIRFLWAHMTTDFERQLYWFGRASVRDGTKQDDFPSWSWISYQGEISFGHYPTYQPSIECYTIHEEEDGYCTIRVNQYRQAIRSSRETKDENLAVRTVDIQDAYPNARLEVDFHLFFYTYSATFFLTPQGRLVLPDLATRYAFAADGKMLGPKPDYGYIIPSPDESELCEMGQRECILIGRRPPASEWDVPHVVVMLVDRASGVARRLGVADMPEEFWDLADKSWQLVALG